MRINDKPDTSVIPAHHTIQWSFEFQNSYTDWRSQSAPRFIMHDIFEKEKIILFGRHAGTGYALKFKIDKFDFIDFRLGFHTRS